MAYVFSLRREAEASRLPRRYCGLGGKQSFRERMFEIVIISIIPDHIATTAFTLYSYPITLCCVI